MRVWVLKPQACSYFVFILGGSRHCSAGCAALIDSLGSESDLFQAVGFFYSLDCPTTAMSIICATLSILPGMNPAGNPALPNFQLCEAHFEHHLFSYSAFATGSSSLSPKMATRARNVQKQEADNHLRDIRRRKGVDVADGQQSDNVEDLHRALNM